MKSLSRGCYLGCHNASKQVGSLIVAVSSYGAGRRIPEHRHANPYFIFTLNGGQEEKYGTKRRHYLPSSAVFHPAGETHSEQICTAGMHCLHVEFEDSWRTRHPDVSAVLDCPSSFQSGMIACLARRVYREFLEMDNVSTAVIEALVLEIMVESFRSNSFDSKVEYPRWLVEARDMLHAQFDQALSLSSVADAVEIHPVHLARTFRKAFRCSVGDYIRRLRVEAACKKLLTDEVSVADLAVSVGFSDQSHFTRWFKRIAGQTPAEYKKRIRS